jgi:hypothetical protein
MVKYLKENRTDLDLKPLIKFSPLQKQKAEYNKKIKRIL